jgi:GTP-binding protein
MSTDLKPLPIAEGKGISLRMLPIRNIAIIAHVDHGKTTLVDKLLRDGGAYRANQVVEDRVMDSMDLEREKGITIKAKNASVLYKDYTINIVDTPGHADFGGEVERIMKMVDGVLLVVDAYEGPQAQTRFVMRKAIENGLKPIVVINKIDREHADPHAVHDQVLELLLELHATEDQFNAPFVYASAKDGFAILELDDPQVDMTPLLDTVIAHIPPPVADPDAPFKMLVSNLDWNDYVGRIAIGKVLAGSIKTGESLTCIHKDGRRARKAVMKLFHFSGTRSSEHQSGDAGDIIGIAAFDEVDIGETLAADDKADPIPFVEIDPPTIQMRFCVNDGPLAGRDGKYVTTRQLRERLFREVRTNISLQVEDTDQANIFLVSARGAMQIAVLIETMRREGYEMCVSRPAVILHKEHGKTYEPYESLWIETPDDCLGDIMQNLATRKGQITDMKHHAHGISVECVIPTRGLIGFETDLINLTSGRAAMSHMFKEYGPFAGDIRTRFTGTLVAIEYGTATYFALEGLQDRGRLFIGPGEEVYEGMIIGENSRIEDLPVNPTRTKQLSNVRSQGEGKVTPLEPPIRMSLERAIEYIADDEFIEATPKGLRLRKKVLNANLRKRAAQARNATA